jgi:hypothetical protein
VHIINTYFLYTPSLFMKQFSAIFIFLLVLISRSAIAQTATDTLPGQAKFTRHMAAQLCTHIQEASQKQSFEQMSPKQADDLFMRLMMTSMGDQATEFSALLSAAHSRKMNTNKLGHDMGVAAVKQLSINCPGSMALLIRTSSAQRELGSKNSKSANDISAEEKAVLQPMADTVCAKIAAEDARLPLTKRTAAQRSELMATVMQTSVLKNMSGLLTVYSMEQIQNKTSMEAFGIKLATLMMTRCPSYLIMLGEDKQKSQR